KLEQGVGTAVNGKTGCRKKEHHPHDDHLYCQRNMYWHYDFYLSSWSVQQQGTMSNVAAAWFYSDVMTRKSGGVKHRLSGARVLSL
ncbi:MAG: hypothetical protein D3922_10895, partial [Candidatus Electrothrix sp. AR1]|nr:hypothetical protein [Candidatus Electrothrix sp. AR1]